MLKTDINQEITVGYKCSSQKSSTSSSAPIRKRTQNWQHKKYEALGATLIGGIHIPYRRTRIDVDEESKSQYGSDRDDISTIYE